jgi:two-component system sensor histidine kinase MtrB
VIDSSLQLPDSSFSTYQFYYLFSLQQQQQTLSLVWRTLLLSGIALVVLLAGIAWLVTRQVVRPVRMAARIAERLADGRLQERMTPKGEDDLARLAASFNKMAESLQRQIRRLEELSRIQRRFVSDVSHELRTPLTTVRMAADVLYEARTDFEPASARSAELLQTQLDRFEILLGDLLEISRHDAGAASLEADAIDVRDLVRHVVEATEPLAARRGSTVTLHMPDGPCICEADSRRVERILRNLLVNAAEHGEGGPIDVHVVADDDVVAIAVRDHGIGLRPGESSLVFNRFWRADPARARTTGGTGLGLSIASEDARLHGGRLQAWGERGKGSQFLLTLPRRAGAVVMRSPIPVAPVDNADEAAEQPTPESVAPAPVAVADPGSIATLRGRRD